MRIIVVEDCKLHQKVVRKIISFVFPKAEVICCDDAYDAWALMKASPKIDLMILDHNMPYSKGGDFIGKIRSDVTFEHLPIIMLTGDDRGEQFLKAGANAYFGKPFNPSQFKKVVSELGLK